MKKERKKKRKKEKKFGLQQKKTKAGVKWQTSKLLGGNAGNTGIYKQEGISEKDKQDWIELEKALEQENSKIKRHPTEQEKKYSSYTYNIIYSYVSRIYKGLTKLETHKINIHSIIMDFKSPIILY